MARRTKRGEYRTQITIYEQTSGTTPNADGQVPEAETAFLERWAKVIPIHGRERFLAQQTQADVTHFVRMRYDSDTKTITPKMWVKLRDGTRLNIVRAYDPDAGRCEIELECNEPI